MPVVGMGTPGPSMARERKTAICQRGVRSLGQNLPLPQPMVTARE